MQDRNGRGRGTAAEKEPKAREARAGETGTTRFGMIGDDENAGDARMTDKKKKGDFDQWESKDLGGNKKQQMKGESSSRTGHKQNAGHGGRP